MKYTLEEAEKILKKQKKEKKLAKKQKALEKNKCKLKKKEIIRIVNKLDSFYLVEEISLRVNNENGDYPYYLYGVLSTLLALGYDNKWVYKKFRNILDNYLYSPMHGAVIKGIDEKYIEDIKENMCMAFCSYQEPLTQEKLDDFLANADSEELEYADTGNMEEVKTEE